MDSLHHTQELNPTPSHREALLEALLYAVAGAVILLGTWFFFGSRLRGPGVEWYGWIRPILLAIGGLLCFVAAALAALRRRSAWDVIQLGVGMIPLTLALGLLLLPIRFVGNLLGWMGGDASFPSFDAIVDRLWSSPLKLAINVAVIAVVILLGLLGRSAKARSEQHGGR